MNLVRLGITIRALRRRRAWRQVDLANHAQTSQQVVSRLERGLAGRTTLSRLERVLNTLEADIDVVVRWRAGALDRLLDERHAALQGAMARRLTSAGWIVLAEVSYSVFGERGSIDLLAVHEAEHLLLVVEIKGELTSIEATLRKHDEKVRLAPTIAARRFGGSSPWLVWRLLVLPDSGSARRRVQNHRSVLDHAYPIRGRSVRLWLRPDGTSNGSAIGIGSRHDRGSYAAGAILFLPRTPLAGRRPESMSPHRVRLPKDRPGHA